MAKIKELKAEDKIEGKTSNDILNEVLTENKKEHFNFQQRVNWKVSTGSLLLDLATGGVTPSLWRFCSKSNAGKTPQMLEILRNIFKDVPNSKALWVIAEGRGLSEENKARCGLKFVYSPAEWETGTIFVFETKVFELVIDTIKRLVFENPYGVKYAFCIDSLDGLMLRSDIDKPITESGKVAGTPMLSKKMLQSLSLGMFKFGHWMGIISQKTAEIKMDMYAKGADRGGEFSGGNSLFHGADIILEYQNPWNDDFILDNKTGKMNDGKTKPIGQYARVLMDKVTKEAYKKQVIKYPIKYGRKPSGIWVERELAELILGFGQATLAGAGWITLSPDFIKETKEAGFDLPEKVQGLENLYKLLQEDEKLTNYLFDKFSKLIT